MVHETLANRFHGVDGVEVDDLSIGGPNGVQAGAVDDSDLFEDL